LQWWFCVVKTEAAIRLRPGFQSGVQKPELIICYGITGVSGRKDVACNNTVLSNIA